MTTMQRIAIAGSSAALSLGLALAAAAANAPMVAQGSLSINPRGHVQLRGTVTKVDTAAKTIGVKVWGTEWTVKVSDGTKLQLLRWRKEPLALAEIVADHSISVTGSIDAAFPLTVTAKRVIDHSVRSQPFTGYVGKVIAVTPPDAFTFQVQRGGQLTVKVTAETKIRAGDAVRAFVDLIAGSSVKVRGAYSSATNTLIAVEVHIVPERSVKSE